MSMLSVIYAECRNKPRYAVCRQAECRYAECRGASGLYYKDITIVIDTASIVSKWGSKL